MEWLRRLFRSSSSPARAAGDPSRAERASQMNHPSVAGTSRRVRPARTEPDWRSYDWDDVAADYARTMAPMTTEPYADLLDLVGGVTEQTLLLDVGTGTGAELENVTARAIGVDISVKMLAEGRSRHTTATLAAADVIDLPFADASVDVVTANFFLPYVTKLDTALFDMLRVLKPGGALAVTVWTEVRDELTRVWEQLATERLGPELVREALKQGSPWHGQTADPKKLERVLRDAGLRPVEVAKRRYRHEFGREDYVTTKEIGVIGRYLHSMLGEERWQAFREHARATYAERFAETVVDFRDVLLAVGRKP